MVDSPENVALLACFDLRREAVYCLLEISQQPQLAPQLMEAKAQVLVIHSSMDIALLMRIDRAIVRSPRFRSFALKKQAISQPLQAPPQTFVVHSPKKIPFLLGFDFAFVPGPRLFDFSNA